jgi:hypothetical protein
MSKLARYTLQQFGSTVNGASEVGEFGSGANGTPTYTGAITLMQSLANWNRGWAAETIANNRPFLEDMNAVDCVFGYYLCYIMQQGIAEYDAGTIYFTNSYAQVNGTLWQSLVDSNLGNTPSYSSTAWKSFSVGAPIVKCTNTQTSGTGGGNGVQGSWTTIVLNTKNFDTGGIASLSATLGQITLPAGTYKVRASCPFYTPNNGNGMNVQSRIYNSTASAVLCLGQSNSAANGGTSSGDGSAHGNNSLLDDMFTLASSSIIVLQYYIGANLGTPASNNLGDPVSTGTSEVYAQIVLEKI